MAKSYFLTRFEKKRPHHEHSQESILEWLAKAHSYSEAISQRLSSEQQVQFQEKIKSDLFKLGLGKGKIEKRGIQFDDFTHEDWDEMRIFKLNENYKGLGLKEKSKLFEQETSKIFESFYPNAESLPSYLIHVSCTGYASPSAAQKIVSKHFRRETHVTHAYHMGCYAALPSIRMGLGCFSQPSDASVDIVHTEICSLHMNPSVHTKEQLVIQSLFADGFIKYSISHQHPNSSSLKILATWEEVIPDSTQAMIWICEDWGFGMTIAKEVPFLLAKEMDGFLERLALKAGLSKEDILSNAYFAIHPGGPKIIEQIADRLRLSPIQIQDSQEVLRQYGNMSSATLPHIWQRIIEDKSIQRGSYIISLAFGPGLTLSGAIFQKEG
jgi:predicted naringenin-chalcone synthase